MRATDRRTVEPDLDEVVVTAADPVRAYLDAIGRTPLLTAAEEVELARRIEAGVYAAELLRRAEPTRPPWPTTTAADLALVPPTVLPPSSTCCRPTCAWSCPSPRSYSRRGAAAARRRPGGQPRPDPRRREVRLRQGLQVLDLRHLVDPPGDRPRHGRAVPDRPAARARPGRAGQGHPGRARAEQRLGRDATAEEIAESPGRRPTGSPTCAGSAGTPCRSTRRSATTASWCSATWCSTRPSPAAADLVERQA